MKGESRRIVTSEVKGRRSRWEVEQCKIKNNGVKRGTRTIEKQTGENGKTSTGAEKSGEKTQTKKSEK